MRKYRTSQVANSCDEQRLYRNFSRLVIAATFCTLHCIKAVQRKIALFNPFIDCKIDQQKIWEQVAVNECAGTEASTT